MTQDLRWKQRFANYQKALAQLTKFIDKGELNELEEQGLIQAFEYTHELAWNVLRDYLLEKGHQNIHGSKDATRAAFKLDLLKDGDSWMDMIRDRNRTSHTYNQETADAIANNIKQRFFSLFVALRDTLRDLPDDID
ncbi:nucleotidyltransferase substrate binding protein [Methylocucumis oryzae]|uniref:Nucleotidyltransferase n=1 Tax=Methylocucumis oryzae TaxID=1632867 RepID=A0A0F3IEZ8_9GAMM|nr:nucleotidyltransferase substrate binding protein [Methylocucumis oryzae]KJV05395.1 nucleotidyltransferase [Methylocucumis oryzae]